MPMAYSQTCSAAGLFIFGGRKPRRRVFWRVSPSSPIQACPKTGEFGVGRLVQWSGGLGVVFPRAVWNPLRLRCMAALRGEWSLLATPPSFWRTLRRASWTCWSMAVICP